MTESENGKRILRSTLRPGQARICEHTSKNLQRIFPIFSLRLDWLTYPREYEDATDAQEINS